MPDSPTSRLLADAFRTPLEQAVSAYYGTTWRVKAFADRRDRACHPAAILSDGRYPVFVKLSEAAHGLHQFAAELAGLRLLSVRAGVLTPTAIGTVPVKGGTLLVLEAADERERTPRDWREIGRTLARIHQVKGERFGLDRQGYFGPLYLDNRPMDDWLAFFAERRLWPRLAGAIDSGNLPADMIRQIEKLIARLPQLSIPQVQPSLLHGDAQQNNYVSTAQGALVIDPAVYYGDPEMDLAYVDYFQPVPGEVFAGYRELLPIDAGFAQRRALWRLPALLAAVQTEGTGHLPKLSDAIKKYL